MPLLQQYNLLNTSALQMVALGQSDVEMQAALRDQFPQHKLPAVKTAISRARVRFVPPPPPAARIPCPAPLPAANDQGPAPLPAAKCPPAQTKPDETFFDVLSVEKAAELVARATHKRLAAELEAKEASQMLVAEKLREEDAIRELCTGKHAFDALLAAELNRKQAFYELWAKELEAEQAFYEQWAAEGELRMARSAH